jgi:hypothetical protein
MVSFWWFLSSTGFAALSVGLTTGSVNWAVSTMILLFAVRNAVMAGYVEGRVRYETNKVRGIRDPLDARDSSI